MDGSSRGSPRYRRAACRLMRRSRSGPVSDPVCGRQDRDLPCGAGIRRATPGALGPGGAKAKRPAPARRALGCGTERSRRWFDAGAGDKGGMWVSVVGERGPGERIRRTWQLTAPATDGPEIPCMAATLLARRFVRGEIPPRGAFACMGYLSLSDFVPEFNRWGITTRTEETRA